MVAPLTVARWNVIISRAKCLCLDIFSCFDFRRITCVRQKFILIMQSKVHRANTFCSLPFLRLVCFPSLHYLALILILRQEMESSACIWPCFESTSLVYAQLAVLLGQPAQAVLMCNVAQWYEQTGKCVLCLGLNPRILQSLVSNYVILCGFVY